MSNLHIGKGNIRKSFGGIKDIVAVPDLIEIQSASFNDFVQLDQLPSERKVIGLEKVLRSIAMPKWDSKGCIIIIRQWRKR